MILTMNKLYSYNELTNSKYRKAVIVFLTFVSLGIALFCFMKRGNGESYASLSLFRSGNGWGYEIRLDDKRIIYQPVIPAIDSACPFPTQESAEQMGKQVLERIRDGKTFSFTREEVERILINHHPGNPGQ